MDPLIVTLAELVRIPIEVVLLVLVFDIRRTIGGHGERLAKVEARVFPHEREHSGETTPISNRRA